MIDNLTVKAPQPPTADGTTHDAPHAGTNWLKWVLGAAGVGMLLLSGLVILIVIAMPIAFRSLLPEQQAQILKHAPFMASFMPTRAYSPDTLPTVPAVNSNAVQALLSVGTETPVSPVTSTLAQPIAVAASPTITDTPLPTSILASVTPTSAGLIDTPTFAPSVTPLTAAQMSTFAPTATFPPPATVTAIPPPDFFHTSAIKFVPQGWNNCGPANLTQVLNASGIKVTQDELVAALKPNSEGRNVSPWQLVRYVIQSTPLKALSRVGGDLTLVKRLVSSKFYVIMETGYIVAGEGPAGHYLTVLGYSDADQIVYGGDTNLGFGPDGQGQHESYGDLDSRWRQFNRTYVVVYPPERAKELAGLLGGDADPTVNAQNALQTAQAEARAMPDNPFTWFNIGSSLTMLSRYQEAAIAFDQSRNTGTQLPWRMLWYQFTPYEAYYNSGRYDDVLALVQVTLGTTPYVEETTYWRGMVEAATGQTDVAIKDFDAVLKFNPGFTTAADAEARLRNGTFQSPKAGVYGHTAPQITG